MEFTSNSSRPWDSYAVERGMMHYPVDVLERLTLKQVLKDLAAHIGLDKTPFRENWFKQKFEELYGAPDDDPGERWRELTALLGLICMKFDSVKLKLPAEWVEDRPFVYKEYRFTMVKEFEPYSLISDEWTRKFHDPGGVYVDPGKKNPWLLRTELANEFADLYYARLREIIKAIGKAGTSEETLIQHRALREIVDECSWYDRYRMIETIRSRLPAFAAEFENSSDPAVKFAVVALNEICTYKGKSSRDTCKLLLVSYWDRLKELSKGAEAKKLIDLIQFEVTELIDSQEAIQGGN